MASQSLGDAVLELRTDDSDFKIDEAEGDAQELEGGLDDAGAAATAMGQAMVAAAAVAAAAIIAVTVEAVKLADVQIQAENQLGAALELVHGNADEALPVLKEWASDLQSITTVGDEVSLSMAQTAVSMGLNADQAMLASQEAIGLAAAFGLSETSAIRYTAALAQGDTTMLNRYIPTLRQVEDDAERVALAHEILGDSFGIAVTSAESGLGPWEQLKNLTGDLLETMGMLVIDAIEPAIDALSVLASSDIAHLFMEGLGTVIGWVIGVVIDFGETIITVAVFALNAWAQAFSELFLFINDLPDFIVAMVPGLEEVRNVSGGLALTLADVRDVGQDMKDALNGIGNSADEGAPKLAEFDETAFSAQTRLDELNEEIAETTGKLEELQGQTTEATTEMDDLAESIARSDAEFEAITAGMDMAVPATEDVIDVTDDLGVSLEELIRQAEESSGAMAEWKSDLLTVTDDLADIATAYGADLAYYITDGIINGFGDGDEIAEFLEQTFADMGQQMGATIGYALGGPIFGPITAAIGAAIGEAVGAAIGDALGSLFTGRDRVGEAMGKFGLEFSDELKEIIKQTAIDLGVEAEVALRQHLVSVIEEMGIESVEAFQNFAHLTELILYDYERGLITAEQATESFGAAFAKILEAAVDYGEVGIQTITDLVNHAKTLGLEVEEIAQALADTMDEALDIFEQRQQLLVTESNKMVAAIEALFEMGGGGARQLDFAVTTVLQAFDAMIQGGVPLSQILDTLENSLGLIGEQADRIGAEVPPEFERLGEVLDILADDQLQGAISRLEQIEAAAMAAGNIGMLTAEQFDFFGDRIDNTFAKLVDGGLTGEEALAAIAPQLQTLHDLSQQYGFEVDANTQKLLDQALAQGVVQDKGMTTNDILIAGFDRMLEGINALIVALGGIPLVFDSIIDSVDELADDLSHIEVNVGVNFDIDDLDLPGFATGTGAFHDFGRGTPAILHGREQVVTHAQGVGIEGMVRRALYDRRHYQGDPMMQSFMAQRLRQERKALSYAGKQLSAEQATLEEVKKGGRLSKAVPFSADLPGTTC